MMDNLDERRIERIKAILAAMFMMSPDHLTEDELSDVLGDACIAIGQTIGQAAVSRDGVVDLADIARQTILDVATAIYLADADCHHA